MAYGYRGSFSDRPLLPAAHVAIAGRPPYAQVRGSNADQAAQVCFPYLYFEWTKAHLRSMLAAAPSSSDPAIHKVFWALDVWAHIQYALFALNIPMHHIRGRGTKVGAKPPDYKVSGYKAPHGTAVPLGLRTAWHGTTPYGGPGNAGPLIPLSPDHPVLNRFTHAVNAFYENTSWAKAREISRIEREPGNPEIKRRMKSAPLMPAPFMSMVQFWTMDNHGNPIWDMVAAQCLPWMQNGVRLPSKGGKDAAEWAQVKGSAAHERALMQWRLWSLRDFYPWKRRLDWVKDKSVGTTDYIKPDWTALGMGRIDNMPTLSTYIANVERQHAGSSVRYTDSGFFPTLQYVIENGLPPLANILVAMDYPMTIRSHVTSWFITNKPKLTPQGELEKWPAGSGSMAGQPKPIGLSEEDWSKLYNDQLELMRAINEADARATNENPQRACDKLTDATERERCLAVYDFAYTFRDWPYFQQMEELRKEIQGFLMDNFDTAVGSTGYFPFFPIPQPFTRSQAGPPYGTTVEGPTVSVGDRVFKAVSALQLALGIHIAPWLPRPGADLPPPRPPPPPPPKGFNPNLCQPLIDKAMAERPGVAPTLQEQQQLLELCRTEAAAEVPAGSTLAAWAVLQERAGERELTLEPAKKSTALMWGVAALSLGAAAALYVRNR